MGSSLAEYRLRESDGNQLSPFWGFVHIICFSLAAFCSFVALIAFERVQGLFEGPCFLYADLVFGNVTDRNVELITSHEQTRRTVWGETTNCAFFRFMTALQIIAGWLLATMFCCIGPEEYKIFRYSKPWQLILPGLCASGLLLLVSGLTAGTYYSGLRVLCDSIVTGLQFERCLEIREYLIESKPKMHLFYFQATIVQVSIWSSFTSWLFSFCSLLLRCCLLPDFEVPKVPAHASSPSRSSTATTAYTASSSSAVMLKRKDFATRKSRKRRSTNETISFDLAVSVPISVAETESARLASPEPSLSVSQPKEDPPVCAESRGAAEVENADVESNKDRCIVGVLQTPKGKRKKERAASVFSLDSKIRL